MYCFINMAILVVELDSDTLPIGEGGKMVCGANGDMTASVHDSAVAAVLRHLLFHLRTMLSPCSLLLLFTDLATLKHCMQGVLKGYNNLKKCTPNCTSILI